MFSKHTLFLLIPVDQLWTKLVNLRSYYTKELKKENDSNKSGAGTDDVYKLISDINNWINYCSDILM
jgi:hypothetical protein